MPHINNFGPPAMRDAVNFTNWKFLMLSDITSSSTQLWRIIEDVFKPHDPENLTPREDVDKKLNTVAFFIIQKSLTSENLARIRPFLTAKEAWDHINKLFISNSSIHYCEFDVVQDEADEFVMNEDDSLQEL